MKIPMKRILLSILLLAAVSIGQAQSSMYGDAAKADVKMKYVYSFEEAMQRARQENKPVFVNWFSDWAIPCHGMNKYVFSDQKFADWMDKNFINLWINAVAPENAAWVDKYEARKMAQFSVLDKNGNMIFRIVGGHHLPEFQEIISMALNSKTTLPGMKARYAKGERNLKFLRSYADVLRIADYDDESDRVIDELFSLLKEKDYPKAENWKYITNVARNTEHPLFRKVVENKKAYIKNVGLEKVNNYLSVTCFAEMFPYANSDKPYDASKMADMYMLLMQCELPDTNSVFGLYEMTKLRGEKNYPKLVESMRKHLSGVGTMWAMSLDVTMGDFKGLSGEERDVLVGYLKERSENLSQSSKKRYEQAIRNLENKDGIQFVDLSFDEAMKKAATEGKRVFMDCYTTWCGPCKMMDTQVFPNQHLGAYFRDHFIALKVDMEKGEGITLRQKFNIEAYPTMLVLDPDETVVARFIGFRGAEDLLNELKELEKK